MMAGWHSDKARRPMRIIGGPHNIKFNSIFKCTRFPNSKRCSPWPPKFTKHSEVMKEMKGNSFPIGINFNIEMVLK
jgi:hypothetical protein